MEVPTAFLSTCRDRSSRSLTGASSSGSALRAFLSCCSLNNSARVTRVPQHRTNDHACGKDRRHCEEKLPEPDPRPARLRPVVLNKCRMACCCDVHVRFDTRYSCCRADASENRLPPVVRPLVFVFSSTSSFLSSSLRLIHPENPCTSSPLQVLRANACRVVFARHCSHLASAFFHPVVSQKYFVCTRRRPDTPSRTAIALADVL